MHQKRLFQDMLQESNFVFKTFGLLFAVGQRCTLHISAQMYLRFLNELLTVSVYALNMLKCSCGWGHSLTVPCSIQFSTCKSVLFSFSLDHAFPFCKCPPKNDHVLQNTATSTIKHPKSKFPPRHTNIARQIRSESGQPLKTN